MTVSARSSVDVLCAGMYRACSTWQYEVVAHLVEEYLGGQRLGYLTSDEYVLLLRSGAPSDANAAPQGAQWRVIKSHDQDRVFTHVLNRQKALAVYAYRDVREVVFSLMHKRGMTFEQLVRQGMIHQVLANDRFWIAQPDVLVQRYEDLIAEPARGVAELARHLGISMGETEATRVAEEYSHESNKARTEALRLRLQAAGVNLDNAANQQICDSTTLLHWNHIRQGNSGSWQELVNPRQRMVLERLCGRWLKARAYPNPPLDGDTRISLRERMNVEIDMLVGRVNFLVRAASQRFPETARTIKRILGLPVDTHAGATAWADPISSRSRVKRTGEPHLSFTRTANPTEQNLTGNEKTKAG